MKKNYQILIVDDEENIRRMLITAFDIDGHRVLSTANGEEAVARFQQHQPDVVLMDIRMPLLDGIGALKKMHAIGPKIPVVLMTAYAEVETAIDALRFGAFDYIIKPFDLGDLKRVIQRSLQLQAMKQEITLLHRALSESYQWGRILINSPAMMALCRDTARIARSQATVLITGESGTGKELIARAIHYGSPRKNGPFIKINCGALPESLLESELFGHEKGAFTGAMLQRQGLFERAHCGTLLLDEVGEMPLNLQVKLLRVLQEREVERIGGSRIINVDIRILAATNRNIEQMVSDGTFRQDLYYRLNVIHLSVPPLRQRPEDISLLAHHFLQKFNQENGREIIDIDVSARALLEAYSWPGNIRELSNVIERAVIMSTDSVIFPDDLTASLQQLSSAPEKAALLASGEFNLKENIKCYEKELINSALAEHQGNRTHTALALGISRRALMYKLQEYGIGVTTSS